MKHHVNQTLKILDDLREAFAEIERLRYGIEQAVSRLAPHAEVHPWVATTADALAALVEDK